MNHQPRRSIREITNSAIISQDLDSTENITWPIKLSADTEGDIILGGLHMIHERDYDKTCGPIMAQGGIQAMETMMFTIDHINQQAWWISNVTLGNLSLLPISEFVLNLMLWRNASKYVNIFIIH